MEGVNYALDLTGVVALRVQHSVPYHLANEAHDYSVDCSNLSGYSQLAADLSEEWGCLLMLNQPYTAPVWLGEFGNCHTAAACISSRPLGSGGLWFASLRPYLTSNDVDPGWWAVSGTETTGSVRTYGSEETYGVLNPDWVAPAVFNQLPLPALSVLGALQTIAAPSRDSGVQSPYPPLVSMRRPPLGSAIHSGTLSNMLDENGIATTASVAWSAPNTCDTPIADQPGNGMMKGYLDDDNAVPNMASVTGLSASFKRYHVYVYFSDGNGSATRMGNYRLASVDAFGAVRGCARQLS